MQSNSIHSDEISLFSLKKEIDGYSWEIFRRDLIAALSVALLTVPQAMAYALLAGLPLTAGLFASIYSSFIAAVFGSSRHLIIGPSNAIAILVQAGTSEILYAYYRGIEGPERDLAALQILTMLVLLVGIIQLLAAVAKLGQLTQFVSHSVIVGYIAGTAIAVVVNQLFTFSGVPIMSGDHSSYTKGYYFFTHLNEAHLPTAIVGVGSLMLLILLKRLSKRIPAAVITLALAAVGVHFMTEFLAEFIPTEATSESHWQKVILIGDRGNLSEIFPLISLPFFDVGLLNQLLPVAFAVALLSVMETTSVAKTIAANSGQRLQTNQEIFGIGLGNFFSSLICAMPISGSPSRSSLNYSLGAQTRVSAILNISVVALILYNFGSVIMHIPLAALSGLLLVTAMNIVQPRQFFMCLKATNSDALVLLVTLLSCIFLSLDVAFYIGVIISITLYLKKAALPQLIEYEIDDEGELHNLDFSRLHEHKTIRVIKVEGELFFGAADIFQTTLKAIAEDDTSTKVIVLQLKNARDIDATSCLALQQLYEYLKSSKRHLVACGILQEVWNVLSDSGLVEQIGKENLFVFDERHPHAHMSKALHRARDLVGESVEVENFEAEVVDESLQLFPLKAPVFNPEKIP